VLLTHLLPDHVGGLSDAAGRPMFPGVEVILSRRELDDCLSPAARQNHGEDAGQVSAWAGRALSGYRPKFLDSAADLGRGLAALPAPGHMAYRLGGTGGAVPAMEQFWDKPRATGQVPQRECLAAKRSPVFSAAGTPPS
jgi:hypothetical protein